MSNENANKALEELEALNKNKPTYTNQYEDAINAINKKINNRKFTYDLNGDALYHQYKDQHTRLGKAAMADTIGRASAMTGGYGNSYALSAGQQAYQGQLNALNDRIPELYQLALSKYDQEGNDLKTQLASLQTQENTAYAKYRDEVGDWQSDRANALEKLGYEAELSKTPEGLLDALENAGLITPDEADAIYKKYMDPEGDGNGNGSDTGDSGTNPVYDPNAKAVENSETGKMAWNGYEVVTDNKNHKLLSRIFGKADENLNRDAKIKDPDGNTYTIGEYYRYLQNEKNYSAEKARAKVIEIQNALGLSD